MDRQFTTISPTHVKGAKPEAWRHFQEGSYVAVGWLNDSDLSGLSDEDIKQRLEQSQEPNWKNGQSDLVNFVNHLKIGDLIAVNNTNHSLFGIGEIISDYEFSKGAHDTGEPRDWYSHLRRVRWLTTTKAGRQDILRPGEKAWEPYGTVGRINSTVPEYIWRLLSDQVVEELSSSLPDVIEDGGEFNTKSGQGFQSDPRRRRAVEQLSMQQAISHYQNQGFEVEVAGKPYDLKCTRDTEILFVEVKGTESAGDYVFLTQNEVKHARQFPMELFVLSKIVFSENAGVISATGGESHILQPWKADEARLIPYAFIYQLR